MLKLYSELIQTNRASVATNEVLFADFCEKSARVLEPMVKSLVDWTQNQPSASGITPEGQPQLG